MKLKTDPDSKPSSREWIREWGRTVRRDQRVPNGTQVTASVLAEHAWVSRHTVAVSSRWLADQTGRTNTTESQHLRVLVDLGYAYPTGRRQGRRMVYQLQMAPAARYFDRAGKSVRGALGADTSPSSEPTNCVDTPAMEASNCGEYPHTTSPSDSATARANRTSGHSERVEYPHSSLDTVDNAFIDEYQVTPDTPTGSVTSPSKGGVTPACTGIPVYRGARENSTAASDDWQPSAKELAVLAASLEEGRRELSKVNERTRTFWDDVDALLDADDEDDEADDSSSRPLEGRRQVPAADIAAVNLGHEMPF